MFGEFRSAMRNWISIAGCILTSVSALLFLAVFLFDLFGYHTNPYIGIVFFLVVPAIFVLGLAIVPIGVWRERRRLRRGLPASIPQWPRIDLNDSHTRGVVFAVLLLTIANVLIISLAAYRGIEVMDSVSFCGQACHSVMQPEYVAHQEGPHARVACVQCHIGPGASSFVRSKVDGVRQVVGVLMNSHSRPIPSPVRNLRPAREVCEQCHWPEKFHGDKTRVIREFGEDEQNTETTTTLQVHVGGGSERLGVATGIHWHMNVANEVEYVAMDEQRQSIGYVQLRDRQGNVREYFAKGVTRDQFEGRERRVMDCMDCHNRPAHTFALSLGRAVDDAMAIGQIAPSVPWVKREVVAALESEYPDHDAASTAIAAKLREFYRMQPGDMYASRREDVEQAIRAADALYRRNVFPQMRVGWGTYPNNIGHTAFPGCFRCHDGEHAAADGSVIRQECDMCHEFQ